MSKTSEGSKSFDFLAFAATRGFSKATLIRSMLWWEGRRSWQRLAMTVQSSPPENRTATLLGACWPSVPGGLGTFKTRILSDSVNFCRNAVTETDSVVKGTSVSGREQLNLPMADTYTDELESEPVYGKEPEGLAASELTKSTASSPSSHSSLLAEPNDWSLLSADALLPRSKT